MKQRDERRKFWIGVVARFESSGRSRREFAAETGVGLAIFQYWLYKLRREREAAASERRSSEVRLVPVTVTARPVAAVGVEIRVAGMRLRVPVGADPGYVARLAATLRETRAC